MYLIILVCSIIMKSGRTIEASGFASVLGFNLRQLIRYEAGKNKLGSQLVIKSFRAID